MSWNKQDAQNERLARNEENQRHQDEWADESTAEKAQDKTGVANKTKAPAPSDGESKPKPGKKSTAKADKK